MKNSDTVSRRLPAMLCLLLGVVLVVGAQGTSTAQTSADEPNQEVKVERKKVEPQKPVKPAATTPLAPPNAERPATNTDGEHDGSMLITRVWLGVEPVAVDDAVRDYLELTEGFGVGIQHVVSGSPAEAAGLQSKDILLRLDDQRLTTPRHLQVLVATYQNGDAVELTILRKGKHLVLKATLGENELPPLSMLWDESAELNGIDANRLKVEPIDRAAAAAAVMPDAGVAQIARLGQGELQQRIADYREEMKAWMRQAPATRGPSPTLNLQAPKTATESAESTDSLPADSGTGDKKNKVEINAGGVRGVRISGGPSITIGHGASIRAGGGVVKINNANGSVSVRTVDEQPIIEIHDGEGKLIHSGPYQRSDDMIEKLPADAQAVLKKMNLSNLNLLNIQVGGQ